MDTAWPTQSPDVLDRPALQRLLTTHTFGRTLYILPATTSTNDSVKTLAQQGAPEGTVVVAEHQTHGRGRYGRTFASPMGVGIYLSLLVRPQVETLRLPPLTLAIAVATAEALVQYCALPVGLKWPNDVAIHGKKVAGILTEAVLVPCAVNTPQVPHTAHEPGKPGGTPPNWRGNCRAQHLGAGVSPVIIIGIGINVNTTLEHLPPELHQHVTSLALASGHAWPRLPLIAVLLAHLERLYQVFHQGDIPSIVQRWLHYGSIIGRQVRFTYESSAGIGTVVGLAEDGALLIQHTDGRQQRLIAGEVTFL